MYTVNKIFDPNYNDGPLQEGNLSKYHSKRVELGKRATSHWLSGKFVLKLE